MPVRSPEELHRLFARRASDGDLEGVTALYEEGATFVGPDGARVRGSDAIRRRLEGLLALAPQIVPTGGREVRAGDIALLFTRWRMTLAAGNGESPSVEGTSTEVARRQPDGGWLYVIDTPTLAAENATDDRFVQVEPDERLL